ncbi:DUF3995 domain-containing protein [Streptomyces sp. NBC_00237]|uniref:DUF3995 domain-containing protein n=1 Tax=Streptomyces sp. NBC_00237 TaxID=2975687 RepID=UPI00225C4091|nr:DUF3995 domain-containing protein [Streptomyces sp. NBC_00237]MCX5206452.1 DUF3995 domain-containing protein [Streptomyces sp. NBC_00237]
MSATLVRTVVPATLATALTGIGGLHLLWTFTPWPLPDATTFSNLIGGEASGTMPPVAPTALVGSALIGSAALTLMVNETLPGVGPERLRRLGVYGLSGVMLLRGVGGYALNRGSTSGFRTWNSALYSPLCIGLGILAGTVAVSATRRAQATADDTPALQTRRLPFTRFRRA